VLSIDLAEISNEESILVAGLAGIMIDSLNSLLQSFSNEFLGVVRAMVDAVDLFNIRTLCVLVIRMDIRETGLVFKGFDGGRGHILVEDRGFFVVVEWYLEGVLRRSVSIRSGTDLTRSA